MPVIQREFEAGGFHVANDAPFQNESLSWEAKGVLGYLFSKPEDWTPRIYDLVQSGPCEKHKIKTVFAELEDAGYMSREKYRTDDGTFDWKVTVYDHPRHNPGWTESTQDGVQPGRNGGANNTDSQPKLNNTNTENERAPSCEENESATIRNDDPAGVRVWVQVTGERPNIQTRQILKDELTAENGPEWDKQVFRKVLKEAWNNVGRDAHRIRVGYLMTSYEQALSRKAGDTNQTDNDPTTQSGVPGRTVA